MKKSITTILLLVIIAGLGWWGYEHFFASSAAPTSGLSTTSGVGTTSASASSTGSTTGTATTTTDASGAPVGQDFLTLLLSVQSIKLDDTIFQNKAFGLLQDFNRPIPPDSNPGRTDPFAPIGSDSLATQISVTTNNASSVTTTTSTLNGSLLVADASTTRWFEYGTTPSLGTMTAPKAQTTPGAFAETVTGLLPNTLYYVKASALIGGVATSGSVITWTTAQGGTQKH